MDIVARGSPTAGRKLVVGEPMFYDQNLQVGCFLTNLDEIFYSA